MGSSVPTEPVLFLKPTTSYSFEGSPIVIPARAGDVHHEVELALVIGKRARKVPVEGALDYVEGYALALDLTARELQKKAKQVLWRIT
jgi:acylpyruvate hydrolase